MKLPDEIDWPTWAGKWDLAYDLRPIRPDTRRFRVYLRFRIPAGKGWYRWAIRIGNRELVWVNRGRLRDGHFVYLRDHRDFEKDVRWPRTPEIRKAVGGPWWKPWRSER